MTQATAKAKAKAKETAKYTSKEVTWKQLVSDLNKVCDHSEYIRMDWHVTDLAFQAMVYRRSMQMVIAIFWKAAPNRDAHLDIDDVELRDAIKRVGSERLNDYIERHK